MEFTLGKKSYRLLSLGISIILIAYTYYLIRSYPEFMIQLQSSAQILFQKYNQPLLYIVIFMMCVNWGIEGYKWKLLTRPIIRISLYNGLKNVLIGLAIGFFTPRSFGDYIGRVFFMPTKDKWKLTGAVLVGRLGQLFSTLFFGILGVLIVFGKNISEEYISVISLTVLSLLILFVAYWFRSQILTKINQWLPRIHKLLKIIRSYSRKQLIEILGLSVLRFLVFNIQFVLVLHLIDDSLTIFHLLPYVWLLYWSKSMAPSINFLTDLGVREFTSVFFLGLAGVSPEVALTAGMFIWFLNVLLPSFVGGVWVWKRS